jgi:hypothetical protein
MLEGGSYARLYRMHRADDRTVATGGRSTVAA